jgi:hypothetical protein
MSVTPRNPYLLPVLAAVLIGGAGLGVGIWAVVDSPASAADREAERIAAEQAAQAQAERKWANEVCGAIERWRSDIDTSIDNVTGDFDVTDPQATWALITDNVAAATESTETLVADLRATEFPDTPDGRAVEAGVDRLLDHATEHLDDIGVRIAAIGGDVGVLDGVSIPALVGEVRAFVDDARTDLEALREPAGDLLDVLRADEDCAPMLDLFGQG